MVNAEFGTDHINALGLATTVGVNLDLNRHAEEVEILLNLADDTEAFALLVGSVQLEPSR